MVQATKLIASLPDPLSPDDPNVRQRVASSPTETVWVGASAGTGKTKVLTDRLLRLLLPRADGQAGTPASRILCLTYTKAAASEMTLRINNTLAAWAVMPVEGLIDVLQQLLGNPPDPAQITQAQKLFAEVMDSANGLQIMTIHAFCNSVLGRFPLEAGLSPNFTMLSEAESEGLLRRAGSLVFEKAQSAAFKSSPLGAAFHHIAAEIDEGSFTKLIAGIVGERNQMDVMMRNRSIDQMDADLCTHFDIAQNLDEGELLRDFCQDERFEPESLRSVARVMLQDKAVSSVKNGQKMADWLVQDTQGRIRLLQDYKSVFLTTEGNLRAKDFPVKAVREKMPESADILKNEALRVLALEDTLKRVKSAALTRDILLIGKEIVSVYQDLKQQKNAMDFDDLVLRTMDLLQGSSLSLQGAENASAWVMYKLDQGIDHILIDEAQDTNPEHWKIIEALCDEFYQGKGSREDVRRTSFVVGDIKQSIYSFQRAAPEEFQRMRGVFAEKCAKAGQKMQVIPLETSFRSTRSVLDIVDCVFADPALNAAVGGGVIRHSAHRSRQAGLAEIWSLFQSDETTKGDLWTLALTAQNVRSASAKLADHIAQKISQWIESKEYLPSYGRPVTAGDILILVRSRTAFVDQLVRALKLAKIPVSGVDRMKLGAQLMVQDMLSLAKFALLPADDLNLACVLKSPFLGWSEEELFALCHGRRGSVWNELHDYNPQKFANRTDGAYPVLPQQKIAQAQQYLNSIITQAGKSGVYEFLMALLQNPCPADDLSGLRAIRTRLGEDALDPLEEFLNTALDFAREEIDTLPLFIAHQEKSEAEIKREMDETGGKVRIMTVHGAKGLQAPIVILPDTIKTAQSGKVSKFLWPNKTGLSYPLWSPRKDSDTAPYTRYYERAKALAQEEEARLLYVAMTRAEDRLYVAGYEPKRGKSDESWYAKIKAAFESHPQVQALEGGELRIENPQDGEGDQVKKAKAQDVGAVDLPSWALHPAPEEPKAMKPLLPSRSLVMQDDTAALSPKASSDQFRFLRGNLTHQLLQFLPDLPHAIRGAAAQDFLAKHGLALKDETRAEIAREVLAILDNPDYAGFFAQNSYAEVPMTGVTADQRIISGQIDRLVVGAADIWILDYKTNRPPPKKSEDVPEAYKKQMAAYRAAISEIYPSHKIHCALLWTDGPILMQL